MLLATAYVCLLLFSYLYYITHIIYLLFFFNDTTTTNIYTLSLHDALPISQSPPAQNKLSVHWEELSAAEFRDGISRAQGTCLLPFGILEEHGPHLPLGNDLLNVRYAALNAAQQQYAIVFPAYYFAQLFDAKH